eukprot:15333149-Ditylum_brightwellii.AAC.1
MQSMDDCNKDMVCVLMEEGGHYRGLVGHMSFQDQWSWFVLSGGGGGNFQREWNVSKSGSGGKDNNVEGKLAVSARDIS